MSASRAEIEAALDKWDRNWRAFDAGGLVRLMGEAIEVVEQRANAKHQAKLAQTIADARQAERERIMAVALKVLRRDLCEALREAVENDEPPSDDQRRRF